MMSHYKRSVRTHVEVHVKFRCDLTGSDLFRLLEKDSNTDSSKLAVEVFITAPIVQQFRLI